MTQAEKRRSRGILWRAGLIAVTLLFLVFLELNKHTWDGWVLTLAAGGVYAHHRKKNLEQCKKGVKCLAFCGLLASFVLIAWLSWPPVRAVPAVIGKNGGKTGVVHTAQGDLTGVYTQDMAVEVYAGIPYAAPPVGDLRWREPQPPKPWTGVLAADHFAPMSMQTQNLPIYDSLTRIIGYHDYTITLDDNYIAPASEDSLYLNVWKPAGDVSGLPVLVYVHGGSLQSGQPWYADYSGEALARYGAVVVNMGYRLGVFGFFADEALAAESENGTTGNYGLLDQIMALKWVRDNIAAFGGDPDNVTLAGESAGSACVSALCVSPLAKGLFRRVVGESSTVTSPRPAHSFRTMEQALRDGQETKEALGCDSIEEMRALPAGKIVGELSRQHHLTVDGYALTETPYEAYRYGHFNEEAQLQGFNRDESGPFLLFDQADLKNYEGLVRALFGESTGRVLALYPAKTDEEARQSWADMYTAYYFSYGHDCWTRQAARNGIPAYTYYFVKTNGRLGAWHSGEEVYLYGNIPANSSLYDEKDRKLSRVMTQYLVNFMKNGDPNGDGLPLWEPAGQEKQTLELGETVEMRPAPFQDLHAILDEMYHAF